MIIRDGTEGDFGRRIRELRITHGLDQSNLARRVELRLGGTGRGFDVTYLSKIEKGRVRPPSEPVIAALAEELGADLYELMALAGRVPSMVGETLKASRAAREFYREASGLELSEAGWLELAAEARRRRAER